MSSREGANMIYLFIALKDALFSFWRANVTAAASFNRALDFLVLYLFFSSLFFFTRLFFLFFLEEIVNGDSEGMQIQVHRY